LAVDDHPLLQEGLAAVIEAHADVCLVGTAATGEEGIRQFRELGPDVTLMDLRLPDMDGIEALIAIRRADPEARVVILSTFHGDVDVQRALTAGARGFLLKSMLPNELVAGIRTVHSGKTCVFPLVATHLAEHFADDALTGRETEILHLIAAGHRNQDVARALSISEDTVKVHVKHLLDKLGAHDRTEAVVIGLRRGILHL
jgi:DNA-binding NarL/FixJ family response regulator